MREIQHLVRMRIHIGGGRHDAVTAMPQRVYNTWRPAEAFKARAS